MTANVEQNGEERGRSRLPDSTRTGAYNRRHEGEFC
jgi:hypothetical protein